MNFFITSNNDNISRLFGISNEVQPTKSAPSSLLSEMNKQMVFIIII